MITSSVKEKPTIQAVGPWMLWWSSWYAGLLAWMLVSPQFLGAADRMAGLRVFFVSFFVTEVIGTIVARGRWKRKLPENVNTLSQLFQRIVQEGKEPIVWWKGWPAFATGSAAIVAYAAGRAFWEFDQVIGVTLGATVFMWNMFHWVRRQKYG